MQFLKNKVSTVNVLRLYCRFSSTKISSHNRVSFRIEKKKNTQNKALADAVDTFSKRKLNNNSSDGRIHGLEFHTTNVVKGLKYKLPVYRCYH